MFWQASGLRMREPILGYEARHSAVTKDRQRQCSLFSRSGIANEESEFNFKLYQYPKPLILDSFPSLRRIHNLLPHDGAFVERFGMLPDG
jgi:hypothetical protein